jgi:hypothetical protein
MSARLSIQVWSVYAAVVAAGLLLVPDLFVGTIGIDAPDETLWMRVIGAVVGDLAVLYWMGWRNESRWFYQATVFGRVVVVVSLVVLALTPGPANLLIFAVVDLGGLVWTQLALNSEGASAPTAV